MSEQGRVSLRGIRKVFGKFVALDRIDHGGADAQVSLAPGAPPRSC